MIIRLKTLFEIGIWFWSIVPICIICLFGYTVKIEVTESVKEEVDVNENV